MLRGGLAQEDLAPCLTGFEHVNRYWDSTRACFAAKILPGEYYVTVRDELIVTVLGSCVSACIRDRIFGIGGMNHFMLPIGGTERGGRNSYLSAETRYGNYAMERLINDILKHGGSRRNLEVKVFGGGRVLSGMTDIGHRNVEFVLEYVRAECLSLEARDLGGTHPRKLVYRPRSGKAHIKKLGALRNGTVARREHEYMAELENRPTAGEVELF